MTRVLRLVVVFYIVCQLFKLVPDMYETMFCRSASNQWAKWSSLAIKQQKRDLFVNRGGGGQLTAFLGPNLGSPKGPEDSARKAVYRKCDLKDSGPGKQLADLHLINVDTNDFNN